MHIGKLYTLTRIHCPIRLYSEVTSLFVSVFWIISCNLVANFDRQCNLKVCLPWSISIRFMWNSINHSTWLNPHHSLNTIAIMSDICYCFVWLSTLSFHVDMLAWLFSFWILHLWERSQESWLMRKLHIWSYQHQLMFIGIIVPACANMSCNRSLAQFFSSPPILFVKWIVPIWIWSSLERDCGQALSNPWWTCHVTGTFLKVEPACVIWEGTFMWKWMH